MKADDYKKYVASVRIGKRLPEARYIHVEALPLIDERLSEFVDQIRRSAEISDEYNVIKLFSKEFKISFLCYPDFFSNPHPELAKSVSITLSTGRIRKYNYASSKNVPILHRKETFLPPDHPKTVLFAALTKEEESEGLYDNISTIRRFYPPFPDTFLGGRPDTFAGGY